MLKIIKKIVIKWALNQVIELHNSEKDFGNHTEYGIDEVVDFTDDNLMIRISSQKTKQNSTISRKEYIPKMEVV